MTKRLSAEPAVPPQPGELEIHGHHRVLWLIRHHFRRVKGDRTHAGESMAERYEAPDGSLWRLSADATHGGMHFSRVPRPLVLFARLVHGSAETPAFASRVFTALGLTDVEERESTNAPPEGRYFMGYAANATVQVCRADDEAFPQYPFWVVLGEARRQAPALKTIPLDLAPLAAPLVNAGIQVLHPAQGWGTVGWKPTGTVYGGA